MSRNSSQPITINGQPLTTLLASREGVETILNLQTDQAQVVVDFLDQALETPNLDPRQQTRYTILITRLCTTCGILPLSHTLTEEIILTSTGPVQGGGFAEVWTGKYRNRSVAVKVLKTYVVDDSVRLKKRFAKEVLTWKRLSHPNVLPFLGVWSSQQFKLAMVSVWMPHGNVVSYVKAHPEVNRLTLLSDVANGLNYLHGIDVVHGDLKGANILISNELRACLADFGLIAIVSDSVTTYTSGSSFGGTIPWMAPELLVPEEYGLTKCNPSKMSDIYALGMVIYEVMTGNAPFAQYGGLTVIARIVNGERPETPNIASALGQTDDVWDTVVRCWSQQINERPNISAVLQSLNRATRYWEPPLYTEPLGAANKIHTPHTDTFQATSPIDYFNQSDTLLDGTFDEPSRPFDPPRASDQPFSSLPLPGLGKDEKPAVTVFVLGSKSGTSAEVVARMCDIFATSTYQYLPKNTNFGTLRNLVQKRKPITHKIESPRQKTTFVDIRHGIPTEFANGTLAVHGFILPFPARKHDQVPQELEKNLNSAFTLGATQLVILITDMRSVKWDQELFRKNSQTILDIAQKIGYTVICSIPVPESNSNTYSTSLAQLEVNMPWYKGWRRHLDDGRAISGATPLEAVDLIGLSFREGEDTFFRAITAPRYQSISRDWKMEITVLSGSAKVGTALRLFPTNKITTITGIIDSTPLHYSTGADYQSESTGGPGCKVTVAVRRIDAKKGITANSLFYDAAVGELGETSFFKARILVRDRISSTSVTSGLLIIEHYLGIVSCQIAEISETIDVTTGKVLEQNSSHIRSGQICRMVLLPLSPVYLEAYREFPRLGRVAVRDQKMKNIGAGFIEYVERKK